MFFPPHFFLSFLCPSWQRRPLKRLAGVGIVLVLGSVAIGTESLLGKAAFVFGQTVVGIPEDDPFADELNPFGSAPQLPKTTPSSSNATPAQPPKKSVMQLPIPFPETTTSGQPADRRQPRSVTPTPNVPFPEAPAARPKSSQPEPFDGQQMGDSPTEEGSEEQTAVEALMQKAEKLDHAGQLEECKSVLKEAIKLDPSSTVAYLALGVVSRRLKDYEGAVEALSLGIAIDPQEPELYLRRGIAWFHMGLYGIAIEDFEDAAGIAYDDPRPELWRGLTLMELKRPLEAINAYASSIRRDRNYMLAYLNRGLAYLSTNEPRKAEFDFDQAIRHNPLDIRAWFNRGVAQARQGNLTASIDSYTNALAIDPNHQPSQRNRQATRKMLRAKTSVNAAAGRP